MKCIHLFTADRHRRSPQAAESFFLTQQSEFFFEQGFDAGKEVGKHRLNFIDCMFVSTTR